MKTLSNCRSALMSSPTNPILSLGMSRGPSGTMGARATWGLPGAPIEDAATVIGASEAPLTSAPMPGTDPDSGFGGVPTDPNCRDALGGVCLGICGL